MDNNYNESRLEQWRVEGDGTKDNRGLNQEQQAAVTSSVNTVAAAGAGAGKTFVLARRYAYLVCVKKLKVSEILTLTFTRKATAEMYSRIYQTLLTVANLFGTAEAIQAVADFHSAASCRIRCSPLGAARCRCAPESRVRAGGADLS